MLDQEYPENFASSIADEIGGDLFAKPGEVVGNADGSPVTPEPKPAPSAVSQQTQTPTAPLTPANTGLTAAQIKALPKSWKKDMEPHWSKLDPAVHDYVYEREANVMRGIQQYQAGHDQWNTLIKPFESVLTQHPDVNPVQLMQGLMNSHLTLLNPQTTPEQKMALVGKLLQSYGLTLPGQGAPDPTLTALQQQVEQLRQERAAEQRRQYESGLTEQMKTVEAFASDPKNKYFTEVANDIHRFLQNGAATDLAGAYELACWANPAVRAKLLADQQAEAVTGAGQKPRAQNGQFRNIDATDPARGKPSKPQSIDQTIDDVVAKHYGTH